MFHQYKTPAFLNSPKVKAMTLILKSRWSKQSEVEAYRFLPLEEGQ